MHSDLARFIAGVVKDFNLSFAYHIELKIRVSGIHQEIASSVLGANCALPYELYLLIAEYWKRNALSEILV